MRTKVPAVTALLVCWLGCSAWAQKSTPRWWAFPVLEGVTNILVTFHDSNGTDQFSITATDTVRRLISLLRPLDAYTNYPRPQAVTGCLTCFRAEFQKPSGTTEILFHNHCLFLRSTNHGFSGWWPMPKEFFAEFYKQLPTHTRWMVPDSELPKP
jgi:hypothetical protein